MFAYLTALGKNELQRELRRRRAELRTAVEHGGNRQSAHAHDADDDDRRRGVESTLAPAPAVLHNTSRSLRQRRRAVVSENLPPPPPPPRVIRRRRRRRRYRVWSAGTVASAGNDHDERHISTDQPVKGHCCQSGHDPVTCFSVGRPGGRMKSGVVALTRPESWGDAWTGVVGGRVGGQRGPGDWQSAPGDVLHVVARSLHQFNGVARSSGAARSFHSVRHILSPDVVS